MTINDPLSAVLSNILNYEKVGKSICIVKPRSKVIVNILKLLKEAGYLKEFSIIKDGRGDLIKVELNGRINKCGVIKPRFSISYKNLEKYEKRYLPAKGFGILILTTSKGFMTNEEIKEKKIGGRLIAYCY